MNTNSETYSELFKKWSDAFVTENQERYIPIIEKLLREQLDIPDEIKINWRRGS